MRQEPSSEASRLLSLELPSKLEGPRARIELGVGKRAKLGVVLSPVAITQTNKIAAMEMRGERGESPQSSPLSTSDVFIFPGLSDIYAKMLCCVVNTSSGPVPTFQIQLLSLRLTDRACLRVVTHTSSA